MSVRLSGVLFPGNNLRCQMNLGQLFHITFDLICFIIVCFKQMVFPPCFPCLLVLTIDIFTRLPTLLVNPLYSKYFRIINRSPFLPVSTFYPFYPYPSNLLPVYPFTCFTNLLVLTTISIYPFYQLKFLSCLPTLPIYLLTYLPGICILPS